MRRTLVLALLSVAATAVFAQAEYKKVDFYDLANFAYNPKEPSEVSPHKMDPSGVPARLRPLDGQKIAITGLTIPLGYDIKGSKEFMLVVSQDVCGFGATPRINEWIHVSMNGGRKVKLAPSTEYRIKGVFHITEQVEDGRVIELYAIDADSTEDLGFV